MEVRSLKDSSCATVAANIEAYSMSQLLRLPSVQRYQLFDTLTLLQIWKLESGTFTDGLDPDVVWKGRGGGDAVPSEPTLNIRFSNSEVCFQRVWNMLEHMMKENNCSDVKPLVQLLFSNQTNDSFIKRIPIDLKKDFIRLYTYRQKSGRDSDAQAAREQAAKVAGDCAKGVLALVVESGYRPSYISYNSLMAYLDANQAPLAEKLLSKVTAVATPGEEMKKKWLPSVLNNAMPALKLGVKGDFPPNMYILVQRAAEKKKIEVVNM